MTVYLLHFAVPLGNQRHQAQHYLGYTDDLELRMAEHRSGQGAAITRAAIERGIAFEVVRTWDGDRSLERRLKQRKNAARLCPICNPQRWQTNGTE